MYGVSTVIQAVTRGSFGVKRVDQYESGWSILGSYRRRHER